MSSSTRFRLLAFLALCLALSAVAHGQQPLTPTWEEARAELANANDTVYVVTIAHPTSRHTCRMQSINAAEIVCSHHGHTTTYRAEDVAALVRRGTHTRWYLYAAAFLGAGGAATWGTVLLASVCAPCAVLTGVAAVLLYWMAPMSAMATDGDSPDKLLYLAPGQSLDLQHAG